MPGNFPFPTHNRGAAPDQSVSTALEASRVAKASQGNLYAVSGYNSRTSSQYIQVHNSATLPADTAVPKIVFKVQPESNFFWDSGKFPVWFETGIVICNSSTIATKTIGSADCWINVDYK